jgi:acyl-Coa thioesterase superfamily protein/acyl-CoA thioesterase superfamily protein
VNAVSFFEPLGGGRYRSTEHTVGPWDPVAQHGGPPAALLARAIEAESPSWPATVVRVTVEILSAVPVAELTVRSRVLRPGRSVELVDAELDADGRPVMRAHAWRIRAAELDLPPHPPIVEDVPAFSAQAVAWPGGRGGYLEAMEWRPAGGRPGEPGPATIWGRMRYPLLPDEEPTGLQRLLILADSGNGVSNVLPWTDWLFINPELTVHVAAVPGGEWICLDAHTRVDPRGFGLAASRLYDRERLVGRGAQSLYIAHR